MSTQRIVEFKKSYIDSKPSISVKRALAFTASHKQTEGEAVIPGKAPEGMPVIDIRLAPFWFGTRPMTSRRPRGFTLTARGETFAATVDDAAIAELTELFPRFWHDLARQSDDITILTLRYCGPPSA